MLVYGLRVASAGLAYLIQIFLARWMGTFEYGIFVYAWTWVVMVGNLADLGFATAAQRFIPEYREKKQLPLLRGFLRVTEWLPIMSGCGACALGLVLVVTFRNHFAPHNSIPLSLACFCLPFFALASVQDGVARSYGWMVLGLAPDYLVRPIAIIVIIGATAMLGVQLDAGVVMMIALTATGGAALMQLVILKTRLRSTASGQGQFSIGVWFKASLPIFIFSAFYLLLTNTDVLILEYFRSPDDVAVYYASSKTLALVAFVSFSVSAVSARRFSEYWTGGNRDQIGTYFNKTIRWTFWPSLIGAALIFIAGKPLLAMFGPAFSSGHALIGIMAVGLIVQASTGPVEAVLNMLHQERACAAVYGISCIFNLLFCVLLIPPLGPVGAALAISATLILKSVLMFAVIKYRLSLHAFIWGGSAHR